MKNAPRILLFIESSRAFGQGLLRGIAAYAREHGPWLFQQKHPLFLRQSDPASRRELNALKAWSPQGAVYWPHSFTPYEEKINNLHLEKLFALDIPTVIPKNLSTAAKPRIIDISNDTVPICRMAAMHLLERGLTQFGFCGFDTDWSDQIGRQFAAVIAQEGYAASFYQPLKGNLPPSSPREEEHLAAWLSALPKPCGIMAINDDRGKDIIEAAKLADLRIPQQIAVLGVDNDEFICEMSYVPLSSIRLNTEKAGYLAAQSLHRRLKGDDIQNPGVVISPIEAVCRQSTDIVATTDDVVADAVRYIRNNAVHNIHVDQIAEQIGVSRRALELRFRKALHCSIHHEVIENRIRHIEEKLLNSQDSISQIARALDFEDIKSLSDFFYRAKKIRPMAWRKKYGRV